VEPISDIGYRRRLGNLRSGVLDEAKQDWELWEDFKGVMADNRRWAPAALYDSSVDGRLCLTASRSRPRIASELGDFLDFVKLEEE
jgi:hypothetical protein